MADIPKLVPKFPDKVITMRRSFVEKERATAKRFLQSMSRSGLSGQYQSRDRHDDSAETLGRKR